MVNIFRYFYVTFGETVENQIEFEIQDMLLEQVDETFIADTLIRRWSSLQNNDGNSHAIVQFLIQCGFYASLCDQMAQRLLKYQELPWQDAVYILRKFDPYIDQEVVDLSFHGLREARQLHLLAFMSHNEDLLNMSVENNWADQLKKVQKYLVELWGDISRQNISPEVILSEISQSYSNPFDHLTTSENVENEQDTTAQNKEINSNIESHTKNVKEPNKVPQNNIQKLQLTLRFKEEFLAHQIFEQVEVEFQTILEKAKKEILPAFFTQAKAQPYYAYDLAVSLFMMGAYKETLQSLDQHDKYFATSKKGLNNRSSDFLKLEVYDAHKCYLELLAHIDKMFLKYVDEDPDIILSLLYFKAKAFWGLNKNEDAIKLMSEIVKKQSDFRCADLMLSKWKKLCDYVS